MSKTAPKISEIFHYAADYCLWDGEENDVNLQYWVSSDFATADALEEIIDPDDYSLWSEFDRIISQGRNNLGYNKHSNFNDFEFGEQRQGVRYAWLKFCAMMAEEQGV